jgi:hypothetical protein
MALVEWLQVRLLPDLIANAAAMRLGHPARACIPGGS